MTERKQRSIWKEQANTWKDRWKIAMKEHRPSDICDIIILRVTNGNDVHLYHGPAFGCLVPYLAFMNIVFLHVWLTYHAIFLLLPFLKASTKSNLFAYFYIIHIAILFCLTGIIKSCHNTFLIIVELRKHNIKGR